MLTAADDIRTGLPVARPIDAIAGVDIYWARLDQPAERLERLEETLDHDERARAARIRLKTYAARFVAARGILRAILGGYVGVEPARLRFRYGASGKPELGGDLVGAGVRFNLSHSHGLALYAVSRAREVGVDLERIDPYADAAGLVDRCFSTREQAEWLGLPPHSRGRAFLNGWTRKEAWAKALGDGLSLPFAQVEVPLRPLSAGELVPLGGDAGPARGTLLELTAPDPGYVAALAVRGGAVPVTARSWPDDRSRWPVLDSGA